MNEATAQGQILLMWKEIDVLRVVWIKLLESFKGGSKGFLEQVMFRQSKIGWIWKWEDIGGSDFWQTEQHV